ncbi:MAG: AAA family ATPase [Clostridia bacterium]|nr:AAA family ATPase [Clostridia bacterium]
MRFSKIRIKNYKGIEETELELSASPKGNVYTLVGINESGKTSILEAINSFEYNAEKGTYAVSNAIKPDFNQIIPIKDKANFNGNIELITTLVFEGQDYKELCTWTKENCDFIIKDEINEVIVNQKYSYKNSKFIDSSNFWELNIKGKKVGSKAKRTVDIDENDWKKCVNHLKEKMPNILYFPTALFDLPDRIYLNLPEENENQKILFYKDVIQDILDSLEQDMNIQTHIIDRFLSQDPDDKENVKQLALWMSRKVTSTILDEWAKVLTKKEYNITIDIDKDETGIYLQFIIVDNDGNFKLSERSLGFRWFFVFLLLTQFRGYRKSEDKQVLFLFDEPASNLSQKAQEQLLKSLERIGKKCTILYTTHSQYLINPKWLENAFIVTNDALLDAEKSYDLKRTNIKVQRYRKFVDEHPQQTSYFQPILDVLEYAPSDLDTCKSGIILEGKYDYYTLNYLFSIILNKDDIRLIPGMSCSNADTLISLYTGWGKDFAVFLDSDDGGKTSKERYQDKFGDIVKDRIFTYQDIDMQWTKKNMESIISNVDKLKIQQHVFPDMVEYSKKAYNKAIQELYMNNEKVELSQETINNFEKIYSFMKNLYK